jgi:hypothetical protein
MQHMQQMEDRRRSAVFLWIQSLLRAFTARK